MTTKCTPYTHEDEMSYFCRAMFFSTPWESTDTTDFTTPEGSTEWCNKQFN